jgi:hypothetical protein
METEYLYTKDQAAELRQKMIATHILPQVKAVFGKYDQIQSIMFVVAQYWCDEANDAVHFELIPSILSTPSFPVQLVEEIDYQDYDRINLPELPTYYDILDSIAQDLEGQQEEVSIRYWNDNGEAIPAFSAFCKEDCDQEMDRLDAYSPYSIFRRKETEIEMEVVGEMLRPWLDGVRPEEWEDEE